MVLEDEWTKFGHDVGQLLALPKLKYSLDMLLHFKTKATQRQLQSKINTKFWLFQPCKIVLKFDRPTLCIMGLLVKAQSDRHGAMRPEVAMHSQLPCFVV